MKKLLSIIFVSFLFSVNAYAKNINLRCFFPAQEFKENGYKMNILINLDKNLIISSDDRYVNEYEIIEKKLTSNGNSFFYINAHRKNKTTETLLYINFQIDLPKISYYESSFDIINSEFKKVHMNKLICNR
tara:strand:- start:320 stop:712 length:393 start_codon:yes stop_codon:yes gene_type:complete